MDPNKFRNGGQRPVRHADATVVLRGGRVILAQSEYAEFFSCAQFADVLIVVRGGEMGGRPRGTRRFGQ